MKIIGHLNSGFILEATDEEIARILGYADYYHLKRERNPLIQGEVVEIAKAWELMSLMRRTAPRLRDAADVIRENYDRLFNLADRLDSLLVEETPCPPNE